MIAVKSFGRTPDGSSRIFCGLLIQHLRTSDVHLYDQAPRVAECVLRFS